MIHLSRYEECAQRVGYIEATFDREEWFSSEGFDNFMGAYKQHEPEPISSEEAQQLVKDDLYRYEKSARMPVFPLRGTMQKLPRLHQSALQSFDFEALKKYGKDSVTQKNHPILWTIHRPPHITWEDYREYNRIAVPFVSLPDEILLLIWTKTNYATWMVLRQTCKRFHDFFVSDQPAARPSTAGPLSRMDGRMVLPLHAMPPKNPRITEPYLECLRRSMTGYCGPCASLRHYLAQRVKARVDALVMLQDIHRVQTLDLVPRTKKEWRERRMARLPYTTVEEYLADPEVEGPKTLFCGFCRDRHPTMFFTHAQRHGLRDDGHPHGAPTKVPARKRHCIGAEGMVGMCQHMWAGPLGRVLGSPGMPGLIDACTVPVESHYAPVLLRTRDNKHRPHLLPTDASPCAPHGVGPIFLVTPQREVLQCWAIPILQIQTHAADDGERVRMPPWKHDLIEGLERNYEFLEELMCGHIAPNDPRLMMPFESGQCICFENRQDMAYAAGFFGDRINCAANLDGQVDATVRAVHFMRNGTVHRFACPHCPAIYSWAMDHEAGAIFFQFASQTGPITKPTDRQWLQLLHPAWRLPRAGEDMMFRTHCTDRYCRTTIEWANHAAG
ncbi:hypothetical protein SPBR_04801 [Sporothrix brasiliensis 5110]|uniref:F-box domain-containing protein n=1 Tax=Sporothrix brasiliensis 5110 TaxID=1398154 RepID=A0A0C2IPQ2_9PEZI|nr:uncharacterized protein SPBR_04801 [Sporothrix brasiliensis 5110]KIH87047.1 hypothetical protein SPBR_04801 [Sporothrix brasiliensis 5110]